METLINDFVREHFATFVICVIIALCLFALVLWFILSYLQFRKQAKCDEHRKKLDEFGSTYHDLPCKTHNDKLEKHGLEVQSLKTSIEYLNKNLDRLNTSISNSGATFTQQHSPLRISPLGWEVVKKLGIDGMFQRNWARIKNTIDSELEQKNAYDINEYCIKQAVVYPEKFLQLAEIAVLKDDAYLRGMALMDYMKIVAVMARDKYFEEVGITFDEGEKNEDSNNK